MSKFVKDLQMRDLRQKIERVGDFVIVDVVGLDATASNGLRLELRKKSIELYVVRNNLTRKVFGEMGLEGFGPLFEGSSALAWGGEGIVELAREIADGAKRIERLTIKGGCIDRQPIGAAQIEALSKLPSRGELLGRIVGQLLSPAASVVAQLIAPAGLVAAQLQTLGESAGTEVSDPQD